MSIKINAASTYELAYHFRSDRDAMRPLYDELIESIADLDFEYKIGKAYIGLMQPLVFACIRVQTKKIIFEFTASKYLESSRFTQVKRFQKHRWAYYLNIASSNDIDTELIEWIKLSYQNP